MGGLRAIQRHHKTHRRGNPPERRTASTGGSTAGSPARAPERVRSRRRLIVGFLSTVGLLFLPSAMTPAQAILQPGEGMLRVTSNPAVPTQVIVDAVARDTWGLTWLELPAGSHTVSFTDVPGFLTPAPQTVTVTAGATTTVEGTFTPLGTLRVITDPAVPGQVLVDGLPRDQWGLWTDIAAGAHQVCFGPVGDFAAPPCQSVTVTAGLTTTITGTYTSAPGTPGPTNIGLLRVTTDPPVPARISVDGNDTTQWGLGWLELAPGQYTVSFSGLPGFATPAPQTINVVSGQTTTVTGSFSPLGMIRAITSPAVGAKVSVDGTVRDIWGMWTDFPAGPHQVCFETVPGFAPVPCQNVNVVAGQTVTVTGTYAPPVLDPAVTGVTPANGFTLGGTAVTISGLRFSTVPGETSFTFGGNAATSVVCATTTSCTAVTPANPSAIPVTVQVVATVNALSGGGATFDYLIAPIPTITSMFPNRGGLGGDAMIDILGTNLVGTNPATITFGGVPGEILCDPGVCLAFSPPSVNPATVPVVITVDGFSSVVGPGTMFEYTNAISEPPVADHYIEVRPNGDSVEIGNFPSLAPRAYKVQVWRPSEFGRILVSQSTGIIDAVGPTRINFSNSNDACWEVVTPNIVAGDIVQVVDPSGIVEQTTVTATTTIGVNASTVYFFNETGGPQAACTAPLEPALGGPFG